MTKILVALQDDNSEMIANVPVLVTILEETQNSIEVKCVIDMPSESRPDWFNLDSFNIRAVRTRGEPAVVVTSLIPNAFSNPACALFAGKIDDRLNLAQRLFASN